MTLLQAQQRFALMVPRLILKAAAMGYDITLGDAYRDPRAPYGHPKSLHRSRLAIDLNLYDHGVYIVDGTGHEELHKWWESIGGGKMIEGDSGHYSLSWDGML